jgi:hypothetical protein
MVPGGGRPPPRGCLRRILSPLRLPFRQTFQDWFLRTFLMSI